MFSLPKYGKGICLSRVSLLLDSLGIDKTRLAQSSVVVAGSNGKGSTAIYATCIGRAFGLKTGTFTSPHLIRYAERFKINGDDIGEDALLEYVERVSSAVQRLEADVGPGAFGAFEAQFALAALYFQSNATEMNVFEAGIGGRYDPTRLAQASVSCVVSLDLEHTELLGASLESICYDKSDVVAVGGDVVYGENCGDLEREIRQYNHLRGTFAHFVGRDWTHENASEDLTSHRFDVVAPFARIGDVRSRLHGSFQRNNATVAAAIFWLWLARTRNADSRTMEQYAKALRAGIPAAVWPGRLDAVKTEPLVVVDVGHTPDAIARALQSLFDLYGPERWVLVTGVSADKKAPDILRLLKPSFAHIVCAGAHHKGIPASQIAAMLEALPGNAELIVCDEIGAAVRESIDLARKHKARVYVAGGLFLGVEYTYALRGRDPAELDFF